MIIDVWSRYVVGWMLALRETAELAEALIAETCTREGIGSGQLTLHADRGSAMTSKDVAQLLVDLGVSKSHSRPHVSDDNPFSEAQFKTAKYHPSTPERFGSVEDARAWAQGLFAWYNHEHHHTSLALLTPAQVHHGLTAEVLEARRQVLEAAYVQHPERFVGGRPQPAAPATEVWINPPLTSRAAVDLAVQPALPRPNAEAASRAAALFPLDAASAFGYARMDERQKQPVAVTAPETLT